MSVLFAVLLGLAALLAFVLLVLAIPVRYRIEADGRQADVVVSAGFGLWRKRKCWCYEALFRERDATSKAMEMPGREWVSSGKAMDTEMGSRGLAWFRRAFQNGALRLVFEAVQKIVRHGVSSSWCLTGRVGLWDPMETGMLAALCAAFFPKVCPEWDFCDSCADFRLYAGGRVFPLYVMFVVAELISKAPVREMLGRNCDG